MVGVLRLSEALSAFADLIGRLAAWLFLPLAIVIFYDISQRYMLNYWPEFQQTSLYELLPSSKLQELEWHIHAVLFLLCLGFTYVRNAHVRVELVREKLKPRTRAWIEMLGCLLFILPYCYLVLSVSYGFVERSFLSNEGSSATTGLPYRWIIKSFILTGFGVLAIAALGVFLRHLVYLFGPPSLRAAAGGFVETGEVDQLRHEVEDELSAYKSDHPDR